MNLRTPLETDSTPAADRPMMRAAPSGAYTEDNAMKAKPKRRAGRTRQLTRVWDVYDPIGFGHCGFLVTEPGELHRVIAYVDVSSAPTDAGLGAAKQISADPSCLDSALLRAPVD
jgi:hypothetical protein